MHVEHYYAGKNELSEKVDGAKEQGFVTPHVQVVHQRLKLLLEPLVLEILLVGQEKNTIIKRQKDHQEGENDGYAGAHFALNTMEVESSESYQGRHCKIQLRLLKEFY